MKILTFLCCMIITFGAFAQKGAFGEDIKTEEEKIEEKVGKVTGEKTEQQNPNNTTKSGEERSAPSKGKRVDAAPMIMKTYSIVLFKSENPIDITHKAMKTFGSALFYRQIPNIGYYYMTGQFKTEADAKKFLETVKVDFPKAEIVNDMDHPHIKF